MLLLQEFDLEIKDKKCSDNVIADHLSRLERIVGIEKGTKIAEIFPDEQLFMLSVQTPWYVDILNYLASGVMSFEFSYQQRRKLRTDCRLYIWDYPLLYRRGADMIIRRCVSKIEQGGIMEKCHASPYGGHFTGDKITQKILQSGFYWLTLFKDYFE